MRQLNFKTKIISMNEKQYISVLEMDLDAKIENLDKVRLNLRETLNLNWILAREQKKAKRNLDMALRSNNIFVSLRIYEYVYKKIVYFSKKTFYIFRATSWLPLYREVSLWARVSTNRGWGTPNGSRMCTPLKFRGWTAQSKHSRRRLQNSCIATKKPN